MQVAEDHRLHLYRMVIQTSTWAVEVEEHSGTCAYPLHHMRLYSYTWAYTLRLAPHAPIGTCGYMVEMAEVSEHVGIW